MAHDDSAAATSVLHTLVYMRHSDRADADGSTDWEGAEDRPYDTPISNVALPREQAAEVAKHGAVPLGVLSSPFRRCIETAAIAAAEWGVDTITVDNRLGEFMPHVRRALRAAGKPDTEWSYMSKDAAVALADQHGVSLSWESAENVPSLQEGVGELLERVESLPSIAAGLGCGCVALVTHGDLVSQAQTMLEPDAVYAPDTCAWSIVDLESNTVKARGRQERIM